MFGAQMINVILCGGSGTRLWPISRKNSPKQFYRFFGQNSLFQRAICRNKGLKQHIIIAGADNFLMVQDQVEYLGLEQRPSYILEPIGRNTAPAIALACFAADAEDILLVSPSDHLIENLSEYEKVLMLAEKSAADGYLVTFGIQPKYAETGYGYLECIQDSGDAVMTVKMFHEKPEQELAEKYVASGNFFWNSGIFCFKAETFLSELRKSSPEIYSTAETAYKNALNNAENKNVIEIDQDDMMKIPSSSIDYAVMEKSDRVKAVKSDIMWSDIGSFDSLSDIMDNNPDYQADVESLDSKNNFIYSSDRKIVAVDIEDTLIVDTNDVLLLCKKGSSQKVKKVVENLAKDEANKVILTEHLVGNRPWGSYVVVCEGKGYKVKRIVVKPGKKLSLQSHKFRSEHWTVVEGLAKVTLGDKYVTVKKNESVYIPVGDKHRLECVSQEELVIIEVQVGPYLGEDDIIRYADDYYRR